MPKTPKTTFNIGRISGGTAVNAIAEECAFEVDLRSEDPGVLDKIEVNLFEAIAWESRRKTRLAPSRRHR